MSSRFMDWVNAVLEVVVDAVELAVDVVFGEPR